MQFLKMLIVFLFTVTNVLCQQQDYFLPKNIKPIKYNLTVESFLNHTNFTQFYGSVIIEVNALEDTNNVTLHAKNLIINETKIEVLDINNNIVSFLNSAFEDERDFFIIYLNDTLKSGQNYKLIISSFTGSLTIPKEGLFLAKYTNALGKEAYLTVTEFEPMHARKAFPCFDEPALKATFIVNLIRPHSYKSASNSKLESTTCLGDGRCIDIFKESELMSTYLLAFVVSDFEYTKLNDRVRLLVRPECINDGSTDYMLSESVKLLKAMEEYTGISYPLEKIDLVAIPNEYFLDGAMENWGLVVYAEKYLLCSNTSVLVDIQKCITFTAHEFAHQWFGNLVTPKKWNYMWLSEGFASYFQYHITDVVKPTWRLPEQYVIEEYHRALDNDIVPFTEPMNFVFTHHDSFPSPWIYYSKASAVIRMTKHFLTEDIFKEGLRIYLAKNQLRSTEPNDLYESYEEAITKSKASPLGNLTVSEVLTTWTSSYGHPIVLVNRNYETGEVTFTQKTYRNDNETDNNIWYIPITYMTNENTKEDSRNTTTTFWLTEKTVTLQQNLIEGWILVNNEQSGFYRVLYDDLNWKQLIQFLQTSNFTLIPPINRAQLIEDAMNYANRKYIDYDLALNLTLYLTQETDYLPLKCFLRNIAGLDAALKGDASYNIFKNYLKKILTVAFTKLGIEEKSEDSHIHKLTRITVAEWMCKYGNSECQKIGLQSLISQNLTISTYLEYNTLCAGIQIATEKEWNILLEEYYLSTDNNRKHNFIKALGCSYNTTIITKFLDILFQLDLKISPIDRTAAFQSMMMFSETGLNTTLEYFRHYDHKYNESIKAAFHDSPYLVPIPEVHLYQLELLRKAGRIGKLPVRFYLESSVNEEGSFSSEFSKWLLKYKDILNLNS